MRHVTINPVQVLVNKINARQKFVKILRDYDQRDLEIREVYAGKNPSLECSDMGLRVLELMRDDSTYAIIGDMVGSNYDLTVLSYID
jgi:hypothetical protein